MSARREADLERGPALCAHTEHDCDCDCSCGRPFDVAECFWPDCDCGCDAECAGCALVGAASAGSGE